MDDNDKKHYNQKIWEMQDDPITSNNLTLNVYFSKDKYGTSCVRLQFNIVNIKTRVRTNFSLSHQQLTKLLAMIKPNEEKIHELKEEIEKNTEAVKSIQVSDFRKLTFSYLSRIEFGGLCVRISIGERDRRIINSDSVYISYVDFKSLLRTLIDFRDSYSTISTNVIILPFLEKINENLESISEKITNYYVHVSSNKTYTASSKNVVAPVEEYTPTTESDIVGVEMISDEETKVISTEEVLEQAENPLGKNQELQGDLDSFIDQNRDDFDLGIDREAIEVNVKQANILTEGFTKDFLKNNLLNLEMYLFNCVNDPNPFYKFCEIIREMAHKDFATFGNGETQSIEYLISAYLKHFLNEHLNNKKDLPTNITPVIFRKDIEPKECDLDVLYDLYLYMIYYSQIRNQLKEKDLNTANNKELTCFVLKLISSPLVFSHIKKITKDVVVSEILSRYEKYRKEGVFEKLEGQCKEKFGIIPDVKTTVVKSEVSRTFDVISEKIDIFGVSTMFERCKKLKLINVSEEEFKKNSFSKEQMLKVILLDLNLKKNGNVDLKEIESGYGVKDFSDLPKSIIDIFKIGPEKYDNSNMIRYIKESCKDDEKLDDYLKICSIINKSFYDLKGKDVNLSILPENVLRAIWLWDLETDKKVSFNYNYYVEKINGSTLDKSMILSMLKDLGERKDSDFVESLKAATALGA